MGKNRTNSHFSFALSSLVFVVGVILLVLPSCGDPEALVDSIVGQVTVATAPSYLLTMQEDSLSSVTPKGTVTVKKDVAQSISAEAVAGYHFVRWTVVEGDGVIFDDDTSSVTTVTLTEEDATILAHCEPDIYTLTIGDDGNGSTDPPAGEIQVDHGVATDISATASDGWYFSTWNVISGTGESFSPANSATTTITLTQGDVTIQATFTQTTYTLTMANDGHGTTTPPAGPDTVAHGADIDINATPADGYDFLNWTADPVANAVIADSGSVSTTVALTGPATVRANFSINTYTLTVVKNGLGTLDPVGSVPIDHFESIDLTATADPGYTFAGWTVESGTATITNPSSESSASVECESNATVQGKFTTTLTVTAGTGGTTNLSGAITVDHGAYTTIEAYPDTGNGYHFVEWQITGTGSLFGPNGNVASTTIALTEGAVEIQPVFALNEYALILESTLNGSITQPVAIDAGGSDTYTVTHGIQVDLRATPLPGYILNWSVFSGDAIITNPTSELTAYVVCAGPATITANFSQIPANISVSQDVDDIPNTTGEYDFGNVVNDGTGNYSMSPVVTFTITNDGGEASDFTVNEVSFVGGGDEANFILTPPGGLPFALAYGAELDFTVQFDPLASGALSATVQIDSNAPNALVFQFDVIGTGDPFAIEMLPVTTPPSTTNLTLGTDVGPSVDPEPVELSAYTIGKYEITYREWSIVKTWAEDNGYTFNPDVGSIGSGNIGSDLQPVTTIRWTDAIAWCNALSEMTGESVYYYYGTGRTDIDIYRNAQTAVAGVQITNTGNNSNACVDLAATGYRLPTEAEWEYAARYKDGEFWTPGNYASGATNNAGPTDYNSVAWCFQVTATEVVGDLNLAPLNPNLLGIYDMSGNVWELCWDWYDPAWPSVPDPLVDPMGPTSTGLSGRVMRGGAFNVANTDLDTARRSNGQFHHEAEASNVGFRIVQ